MTLILKSSEAVNIKNMADVMPNPSLHFDFRSEAYSKDGQPLSDYTDLITHTRPSFVQGLSGAGSVIDLPANILKPITDFNGVKGLPIVGKVTHNIFLNSHEPVTQQITANFNILNAYILQVVGNGEAKLSVAGVVIGTAKQAKPFVYKPTTAGSQVVTVEVSGNPYYVGFCVSTLPTAPQVMLKTDALSKSYGLSSAQIQGSTINPLLSNGNGTIAFRHHTPKIIDTFGSYTAQTNSALILTFASSEQAVIAWQNFGAFDYALRTGVDGVEHMKVLSEGRTQDNVYVLKLETGILTAYCNGKLIGSVPRPTGEISSMHLGSGSFWGRTAENLIQELAVYSDVVSDEQAKAMSSL